MAVAGAAPTMRRLEEQVFQYTYQNLRPRRDLMLQLRNLQQHYLTLDNDRAVVEFFEAEPGLPALLHEAVRPLTTAFGEGSLFHVRLQSSEDETLLKVAVRLPAGFVDAERALCTFDQEWWLNNCHRSGGALVFDYETQDAV
ncbi:MAG: hypothetical protein ABJA98_25620 [Acidobacteriota bacterium]